MNAYLDFWKRWNDFKGRTSRRGFWIALGVHILLNFLLRFCMVIMSVSLFHLAPEVAVQYSHQLWFVFSIFWLIAFIAMTLRRLRDAGYSAQSFFWLLVPVIGFVALIARLCEKSTEQTTVS